MQWTSSCRPVDWQPLELARDPVPGDPTAVLDVAAEYAALADAVRTAALHLQRIADAATDQRSDAVDAFRGRASAVAASLLPIEARYRGGAEALQRYAVALHDGQESSAAALREAREAQERKAAAVAAGEQVLSDLAELGALSPELTLGALGDGSFPDERAAWRRARSAAATADADLAAARRRCERAAADVAAAAAAATGTLDEARAGSGTDDRAWHDVRGAVAWVTRWSGRVSAVLGILALVVAATGVLAPVAAALAAVALGLGVVALVGTAVQAAHGEASSTDVGLAALGVLSGGVGKAVAGTAKVARAGARDAVVRESDLLARGLPAADVPAAAVVPGFRSSLRDLPRQWSGDLTTGARLLRRSGRSTTPASPPSPASRGAATRSIPGRSVGALEQARLLVGTPRQLVQRGDVAPRLSAARRLSSAQVVSGATGPVADVTSLSVDARRSADRRRVREAGARVRERGGAATVTASTR